MTNLTEKWQKGELPEGWYYVKDEDGQIIIAEYYAYCIDKETNEAEYDWSCCNEPEQVLEKVPSYEEWDKLNNACHELEKETACLTVDNVNLKKWCEEFNALDVAKENTKLKDLLKEIRGKLHYINTPVNQHNIFSNDFIKKLDQVLGEE